MNELAAHDFDFLADILLKDGGMVLERGKDYLISTRLMPVAQQHGFPDLTSLVNKLRGRDQALRLDVVDAMTVNETSWFRDPRVWVDVGTSLLPELLEKKRTTRRLDVWVAASSSGQEAYTLGMLLTEVLGDDFKDWRVSILATDLSRNMVRRTNDGLYGDYEMSRGLSKDRLQRFFEKGPMGWRVSDQLRSMVTARESNLTAMNGTIRGPFDLILLRNVLIYFQPAMRTKILAEQAALLAPYGRLVLGASESALGVPPSLARHRSGTLVTYGRADEAEGAPTRSSGISAATSNLLAQFPRADQKSGGSGPGKAAAPATASGLVTVPATAPPNDGSVLEVQGPETGSEPTVLQRLAALRTEAAAMSGSAQAGPDQTPAAKPALLGQARVDADGLTPLERLRAIRKEYHQQ